MSNNKLPDDEPDTPTPAKRAKTAAEPEAKKPKVSFRPTGKGGKKKLAPFQSEDPSYKPTKEQSDDSELSDAGMSLLMTPSFPQDQQLTTTAADPLDISLWPEPVEVVKFPAADPIEEPEEEEEPAPPMAKKAATKAATKAAPKAATKAAPKAARKTAPKAATKVTAAASKATGPPGPAKTLPLTAAAAKAAAAKAAEAAQGTYAAKVILRAPPMILPTIHGIREPYSDATTSSDEDDEESDEEPAKKGKGKGKATAKKAAGVTTRGKAKQVTPDESEEDEEQDEDDDEEVGDAEQSPVSATAQDQNEEEEGPPANPSPALKAMKVKVKGILRAPDSPNTEKRGLNAKMYQLPSGHKKNKPSITSITSYGSSSSPSKIRSRGRGMGHRPKVSLSPNPRLFGKGTSPDPLQSSDLTHPSSSNSDTTSHLAHIAHLRARLHNLQTNPFPAPPSRLDYDHPSVTKAREQRMMRDAYTGRDPNEPEHPGSPWAALQKQVDEQVAKDDESYAYAMERYHRRVQTEIAELQAEIQQAEQEYYALPRQKRISERVERYRKRMRLEQPGYRGEAVEADAGAGAGAGVETEFARVQRLQAEAARKQMMERRSQKKSIGEEAMEAYRELRKAGVPPAHKWGKVKVPQFLRDAKIKGFEGDYVEFEPVEGVEEEEYSENEEEEGGEGEGEDQEKEDEEYKGYEGYEDEDEGEEYGEEYIKQAKWMQEQRRAVEEASQRGRVVKRVRATREKGKGKEPGEALPRPGRVTSEDLEALAASYPGSIG